MTQDSPRRRRPRLPQGSREALLREIQRQGLDPPPDPAALRAALAEARAAEAPPEPAAAPTPEPASAAPDPGPPLRPPVPADAWAALPRLRLDPRHLGRHLVITATRDDPAHGAFDVLRAKAVEALRARGWRRLGVTSPTAGCGKSFTAANLAVTLSRLDGWRTLLLDLDLHHPGLARTLGVRDPSPMGELLRGALPPEAVVRRVEADGRHLGPSLAVALNGAAEPFAAELLQSARAARALDALEAALRPNLVLMDLPPALAQDDVIALKPRLDCVLLVAGGGSTTAREIKECVRRLGDDLPILGVVLNRGEGEGVYDYAY